VKGTKGERGTGREGRGKRKKEGREREEWGVGPPKYFVSTMPPKCKSHQSTEELSDEGSHTLKC